LLGGKPVAIRQLLRGSLNLQRFLDTPFGPEGGLAIPVGNYRWGMCAFFDYDGEPIYVGQTNEWLTKRRATGVLRPDRVTLTVP